ncbi:MAG: DUF3426 domain-containing protein [Pseudomonadota bacterium]
MRSITNCPACQTQFFVTDEQLNQHNGKVRCGNCLNVFDATQQIVELDNQSEDNVTAADNIISGDIVLKHDHPSDAVLLSDTEPDIVTSEIEIGTNADNADSADAGQEINHALISDPQPSNFADLADKSKLSPKRSIKAPPTWLMIVFAVLLLLVAIVQSIYFLRNEIAIYYPKTKPYLVQACEKITCSIDLPKKIEFIVIDDSNIQEDTDYVGLMRLSSTLINQAGFSQAYPNLELTLTDTEDKPKLRRFFKPSEYLALNTNIAQGLAPGEEVKIKLAMTTHGETVAGYRVFVTY